MSEDGTGTEGAVATETAPDTGWVSGDGTFGEGAPENVQALMETKKWTNVGQVIDAYSELEKFKGAGEHLLIPEAEDVKGWDNIFNRMGRPETHDKYEFTNETDIELSDELVGQFKEFAHGLGLSQKQFKDVIQFEMDAAKSQMESYAALEEKGKEENLSALRAKYGESAVVGKISDARSVAEKLGIYQILEQKGLASDVSIIDMLINISTKTAEDTITAPSVPKTTETPEEELEKLKTSEELLQKFHPKHKEAHRRFVELNQMVVNNRR